MHSSILNTCNIFYVTQFDLKVAVKLDVQKQFYIPSLDSFNQYTEDRGLNDLELDTSSMEKRFAYKFLKRILKYIDSAQEFIAHLEAIVTSGKTEKSPHDQEIKFFAKVLLPLVDQYFTNHCLYFLSSPTKPLGSSGYASNKEKEMVARNVSVEVILDVQPQL
ncbi:PREDICTED: ryanodine receptor 3-like [Thamnophis sirtalis]|uniref:Ryanodine receptor 3-like n=1 Tax=Thamnophis sirtalis TaxID=35019 RepID=A0A6I9Z2U3_9SAUR|nr:PREDICTED: ryanodine receptor 3-like [Thamnophis sirtalis]